MLLPCWLCPHRQHRHGTHVVGAGGVPFLIKNKPISRGGWVGKKGDLLPRVFREVLSGPWMGLSDSTTWCLGRSPTFHSSPLGPPCPPGKWDKSIHVVRIGCRDLRTVAPLPWALRRGFDFPRRGSSRWAPKSDSSASCMPRRHKRTPAPIAPPAGSRGAGPEHAVQLPHRRPCWSTPGRVQPSVLLSPAGLTWPRTGWGAQTSGCRPPLSPGLPRSQIGLWVGARRLRLPRSPWESFPGVGVSSRS